MKGQLVRWRFLDRRPEVFPCELCGWPRDRYLRHMAEECEANLAEAARQREAENRRRRAQARTAAGGRGGRA